MLLQNSQRLIRFSVNGTKLAGMLLLASAGGWVAYSTIGIEHNVPLPPALPADREVMATKGAGYLSYYLDCTAQGRPLVLIHSINAAPSAIELKPLFMHYRTVRPVYALDLPGFGFSERGERSYAPALYQTAIREFLEKKIGEPADLVALSLSSEFAAGVALSHPELVNSLVLLSPTGLNAEPSRIAEQTSQRIYSGISFPLWSQPLYDLLTTSVSIRYFLDKNFVDRAPDELVNYAYATSHQPWASVAPFHFLSGQLFTWDIRQQVYEQLQTPTLVVYDEDPNVDFGALPEVLRKNSAVTAARISPTRGLAHWDKPAETMAALDRFWRDGSGN